MNGQLVSWGDVQGIAAAFRCYVGDSQLRRRHGESARLRVEQDFSLQRMAQQYADLYYDVTVRTVGWAA
jgi:glycosyltransferase involved in cell wall biosynthesis